MHRIYRVSSSQKYKFLAAVIQKKHFLSRKLLAYSVRKLDEQSHRRRRPYRDDIHNPPPRRTDRDKKKLFCLALMKQYYECGLNHLTLR